ncbi:MAG: Transcriptional regulatory protein ZraR [Planctomycetota bacterium]
MRSGTGANSQAAASRFLLGYLDAIMSQEWSGFDSHIPAALTWAELSPDLQAAVLNAIAQRYSQLDRWGDHALIAQRMGRLLADVESPWARGMIHRTTWYLAMRLQDIPRAVAIAASAVEDFHPGSDLWLEFLFREGQSRIDDGDVFAADDRLRTLRQHAAATARFNLPVPMLQDAVDLAVGNPERILTRTDDPPPSPWHRCMALLDTGRHAEAQALIRAHMPADGQPPAIDSLVGQLQLVAAIHQRRYCEVKAILDRASTAAVPAHRPWILGAALTVALDQRHPAAARAALSTLDPDGRGGAHLFSWVRLHLLEGDVSRAQEAFTRLVARCPQGMVERLVRAARGFTAEDVVRLWPGSRSSTSSHERPMRPASNPTPAWKLVGDSPAMVEVRAWIAQAAQVRTPVLISGETGTGKEIAARLLHLHSPAAREPFVALNCGAISETLAEAELFGHARGAFTGAVSAGVGLIAAAGAGILFLDEINSLSLRLQAMLLRLLENGEYRPLGSTATQRAECRIILATNQDLAEGVAAGTFRADLRFRLERLVLHMPPLREHPQDIPALVRHFLDQLTDGHHPGPTREQLDQYAAMPWPGNIRELRNEVERLVLLGSRHRPQRRGPRPGPTAPAPVAPSAPPLPSPTLRIPGPPAARERRTRIMALFDQLAEVYPADAMAATAAAATTVARDFAALESAGLVRRIPRGGHSRLHPYVRVS